MDELNCKLCGALFSDGQMVCTECGSHRVMPSYRYTAERGQPLLEAIVNGRSIKVAVMLAVLPLCALLLTHLLPAASARLKPSTAEQAQRSNLLFDNLRSELQEPDAYAAAVKPASTRPAHTRHHRSAMVAEAGASPFKD